MSRKATAFARRIDRIPTPDELDADPELAILAALDLTLELALRALACAHPELADPERPYWLTPSTRVTTAAKTVIDRTAQLARALGAYRKALDIRRRDQAAESRTRDELF